MTLANDLVIYGFGTSGFGFTDLGLTDLDLRICPLPYALLLCVCMCGIKLTLKCLLRFTKFLQIRNPHQISSDSQRGRKKRKQFCINLFRFERFMS